MRKERPLRKSIQTKNEQQLNSKKTYRRRKTERFERINERIRREYKPFKRHKGNQKQTKTIHSHGTIKRDKETICKRHRITKNSIATRRTNDGEYRHSENSKPLTKCE